MPKIASAVLATLAIMGNIWLGNEALAVGTFETNIGKAEFIPAEPRFLDFFRSFPLSYKRIPVNIGMHKLTALCNGSQHTVQLPAKYQNQQIEWVVVKNATSYPFGGVFYSGSVFYFNPAGQHITLKNWPSKGIFTKQHHNIVFNYAASGFAYGHAILDILPLLTAIEPSLKAQSRFIMTTRAVSFVENALPLFGVPKENIIFLKQMELVTADVMVMVSPARYTTMDGSLLVRMRVIIAAKIGLDLHPPRQRIFYNRREGRRICDMRQIMKKTVSACSNVPARVYMDEMETGVQHPSLAMFPWAEKLYFFNQMIFLFALHGSGSLNAMFMQRDSVLCLIETRESDANIFKVLSELFLPNAFLRRDPRAGHWQAMIWLMGRDFLCFVRSAFQRSLELEWHEEHLNAPAIERELRISDIQYA